MGYKQPGFGNGEKAPSIHSSPLNLRSRKKKQEARESEGKESRSGVTVSSNQYSGKSNKQIKKLREQAAKKANKAESRLAGGKKLSKRQQDAIAERDYNLKRDKEIQQSKDQQAKNVEIYGANYGPRARARLDQKAMEKADAENQAVEAEASVNRFRDPGLVASDKRDPSEANMPDVNVIENKKKPGFNYQSGAYSNIYSPEDSKRRGVRTNLKNSQIRDFNTKNIGVYDDYGVSTQYKKNPEGWKQTYGFKKGAGEAGRKRIEAEWSGVAGKDALFPTKKDGSPDYTYAYKRIKEKQAMDASGRHMKE